MSKNASTQFMRAVSPKATLLCEETKVLLGTLAFAQVTEKIHSVH